MKKRWPKKKLFLAKRACDTLYYLEVPLLYQVYMFLVRPPYQHGLRVPVVLSHGKLLPTPSNCVCCGERGVSRVALSGRELGYRRGPAPAATTGLTALASQWVPSPFCALCPVPSRLVPLPPQGVRTKTVKKASRVIIEKYAAAPFPPPRFSRLDVPRLLCAEPFGRSVADSSHKQWRMSRTSLTGPCFVTRLLP